LAQELATRGIDTIYLLAPTTTAERVRSICEQATGYLYYVSLKGVTGAANIDVASVREKLATIRQYTDLPLAVGFGIKDAATASALAPLSDGIVVGSALVHSLASAAAEGISEHEALAAPAVSLIAAIRSAIDSV
jgi:tryptophan synthase alpha chain